MVAIGLDTLLVFVSAETASASRALPARSSSLT